MDRRARVYEAPMCSNWLWLNVISRVISSTEHVHESTVTSRHKYDNYIMNCTAHNNNINNNNNTYYYYYLAGCTMFPHLPASI